MTYSNFDFEERDLRLLTTTAWTSSLFVPFLYLKPRAQIARCALPAAAGSIDVGSKVVHDAIITEVRRNHRPLGFVKLLHRGEMARDQTTRWERSEWCWRANDSRAFGTTTG